MDILVVLVAKCRNKKVREDFGIFPGVARVLYHRKAKKEKEETGLWRKMKAVSLVICLHFSHLQSFLPAL